MCVYIYIYREREICMCRPLLCTYAIPSRMFRMTVAACAHWHCKMIYTSQFVRVILAQGPC